MRIRLEDRIYSAKWLVVCLGIVASFLSGCVTNGAYPGFAEVQPKIKTIAIIPPDVIVGHVTANEQSEDPQRLLVRDENREAIYRQSVVDDQALLFRQRGYQIDMRLVKLSAESNADFKSNYLSFVQDYTYASANATLPATTGGQQALVANVQKSLKPLEAYTNADAFIFTRFVKATWDPTSNTEKALTTALFGFIAADDLAKIELACIERGTGKLLWRKRLSTHLDYFVYFKQMLEDFPAAAGNDAIKVAN